MNELTDEVYQWNGLGWDPKIIWTGSQGGGTFDNMWFQNGSDVSGSVFFNSGGAAFIYFTGGGDTWSKESPLAP
jgi:hypothetical protein